MIIFSRIALFIKYLIKGFILVAGPRRGDLYLIFDVADLLI